MPAATERDGVGLDVAHRPDGGGFERVGDGDALEPQLPAQQRLQHRRATAPRCAGRRARDRRPWSS